MTSNYWTAGPPSSPPEDELRILPYDVTCHRCGHHHDAGTTVAWEPEGWACVTDCGGAA